MSSMELKARIESQEANGAARLKMLIPLPARLAMAPQCFWQWN